MNVKTEPSVDDSTQFNADSTSTTRLIAENGHNASNHYIRTSYFSNWLLIRRADVDRLPAKS